MKRELAVMKPANSVIIKFVKKCRTALGTAAISGVLTACSAVTPTPQVDLLIQGGLVYDGSLNKPVITDIAVRGERIVEVGGDLEQKYQAAQAIDASGQLVAPGFIDPHTHSLGDLLNQKKADNLNYLTQGVTTVFNGNDGGGPSDIEAVEQQLNRHGIGTNTAFFVGHGTVRKQVMGKSDRHASADELAQMKQLIAAAMDQGALGLSSGLYYVPGSYAPTAEVIELSKVVAKAGGVYESHIRDESSYTIGLIAAIEEALEIGKQAELPVHIAHIKALGVDVWGKSEEIVALINQARAEGQQITADQYPWLASGTRISNALFPKWAMADSEAHFHQRLTAPATKDKIRQAVKENLRKRGGAEALLLVADTQSQWLGKTLAEVAGQMSTDPVSAAFTVVLGGDSRVASFNMNNQDVVRFMRQPWVMTSSDGTNGHPRKYASFPHKYQQYVKQQQVLSTAEFIHRSSGQVADTFMLAERGYLRPGYFADIIVFDPGVYSARADFANPAKLSQGIEHLWVNGQHSLAQGKHTGERAGKVLKRNP